MYGGHYACKCKNSMKNENNQNENECSMCIKQNLFNECEDKFKNLFQEFKGKQNYKVKFHNKS